MPASTLIGRNSSTAAIDELLGGLPDRGGALVLRGDAGIGKSALLAAAAARAGGARTLAATGAESEAELPFAGLHQLLLPVASEMPRLSQGQRDALQAALGLTGLPAPDRFH